MTEHSKRYQEIAKRVLQVYDSWPTVQATTIGGSVARGVADECSDVDLFVFCETLPSEQESREAAGSLGGDWWQQQIRPHGFVKRDLFGFENARLDVDHVLISRVRAYPDGLQTAMINQHLIIEPLWIPYEYQTRRDDFFFVQKSFITTIERVMGILLGVNRLYKPSDGYKRIERLTDQMGVAPDRLYDRLRETFTLRPVGAINHLSDIVEETFDLVEKHCPLIDVSPARREFRTDSDMAEEDPGRGAGR